MYIPIDKLYGWIHGISPDIIVSYFSPHGSRNFENITIWNNCGRDNYHYWTENIIVVCHDQEPLMWQNFEMCWQDLKQHQTTRWPWNQVNFPDAFWQKLSGFNLAAHLLGNFYDHGILLHSEQRSSEVSKFEKHFYPVYYWCHGLLARDWYRYAKIDPELQTYPETFQFDFNIYARAWQGTREYRLKFLYELESAGMVENSRVTFCSHDDGMHYRDHAFKNLWFKIPRDLPFQDSVSPSSLSAEYDAEHYRQCAFDCVLETLFDDSRLHLTEKTLRPIACGKPFLLAASHGSLEYLRTYGFRTFSPWIDESYDAISDPLTRLEAIIKEMHRLSGLPIHDKHRTIQNCHAIAKFNQQKFFSCEFSQQIVGELIQPLQQRVDHVKQHHRTGMFCDLISQSVSLETEVAYTDLLGIDRQRVNTIRAQLGLGQR